MVNKHEVCDCLFEKVTLFSKIFIAFKQSEVEQKAGSEVTRWEGKMTISYVLVQLMLQKSNKNKPLFISIFAGAIKPLSHIANFPIILFDDAIITY